MKRAMIFLLDSFGIGGAPDAEKFGDKGADTFGHIYGYYKQKGETLLLPNMYSIGLLHAASESGGKKFDDYTGDIKAMYGFASSVSHGKDTLSGHWEMTGVPVMFDWGYFPDKPKCFPDELVSELIKRCSLSGVLGEKHASGTEIIKELGEEHCHSQKPIIYTSADSVFQIAAHEEEFGLDRLYKVCEVAFELVQKYNIARVIARPFVGKKSSDFTRTANRHDYAVPAPADTLLDIAYRSGRHVSAVGKIYDIFAQRGITTHVKGQDLSDLMDKTIEEVKKLPDGGFLFTNFVDFDSKFGHRRDAKGYGEALKYIDSRLPEIFGLLHDDDMAVLTADHGCDPTWQGSDHTRENIPALFFGPKVGKRYFGQRHTFSDIGQTLAKHLGLEKLNNGTSII